MGSGGLLNGASTFVKKKTSSKVKVGCAKHMPDAGKWDRQEAEDSRPARAMQTLTRKNALQKEICRMCFLENWELGTTELQE